MPSTNICGRSGATRWSIATCSTSKPAPARILNEAGTTLLSQVSQVVTLDYRDSKIHRIPDISSRSAPTSLVLAAMRDFVRGNINGAYYIPLERSSATRLGSQVLRQRRATWICCPADERKSSTASSWAATICAASRPAAPARMIVTTDDPLGGRFIWTQSTELRFPLPVSPDLGLSGRAFVDVGGLTRVRRSGPAPAPFPLAVSCTDRGFRRAAGRRRCRHLLAYRVRSDKR